MSKALAMVLCTKEISINGIKTLCAVKVYSTTPENETPENETPKKTPGKIKIKTDRDGKRIVTVANRRGRPVSSGHGKVGSDTLRRMEREDSVRYGSIWNERGTDANGTVRYSLPDNGSEDDIGLLAQYQDAAYAAKESCEPDLRLRDYAGVRGQSVACYSGSGRPGPRKAASATRSSTRRHRGPSIQLSLGQGIPRASHSDPRADWVGASGITRCAAGQPVSGLHGYGTTGEISTDYASGMSQEYTGEMYRDETPCNETPCNADKVHDFLSLITSTDHARAYRLRDNAPTLPPMPQVVSYPVLGHTHTATRNLDTGRLLSLVARVR